MANARDLRMQADFEPVGRNRTQLVPAGTADMRSREQRTVEERAQSVMLEDRCARDLGQESGTEDAPQRPAGMVRTDAEEKRGLCARFDEKACQIRHPLPRSAQRIHVDFQCEPRHADHGV